MPAVSIVIPCYNQGEYLHECLTSVIGQTFRDWEAIVVDDASTSGNPSAIVAGLGDRRVKCLRHARNAGLGAARNTGFREAVSHMILPLDADDYLHEDYLALTSRALASEPGADCAFTDFQHFGKNRDIFRWWIGKPGEICRHQWIAGAGVLMRKKLWEGAGGYSEDEVFRFGNEDWDFWIAASKKGFRPVHIPKPLYFYRRYDDSMSLMTLRPNDYLTRKAMLRRHRAFFETNRATKDFLANGYLNSSAAVFQSGRRLRGMLLAATGLTISPSDKNLWRQVLRSLTPRIVLAARRRFTTSGREGSGGHVSKG
jgi:glycosyltransferase involved in cell wall biosynthesis